MTELVIGPSLEQTPHELAALRQLVDTNSLRAMRVNVADGDVRYWGVHLSQSPLLRRLRDFGETCFSQRVGRRPALSFVMMNVVDASTCPTGSGGGWHRDSLKPQFKAFVYLTDVERTSQGAFCFVPASSSLPFTLCSAIHKIVSGGHRYRDKTMDALLRAGISQHAVLLKKGIPFFLRTSLIHRGLPISEGRRIAATLYMYEGLPAEFADLKTANEQ